MLSSLRRSHSFELSPSLRPWSSTAADIRDNSLPGEYARLVDRHKLEFLDYREP
jgi:hypothetical protein